MVDIVGMAANRYDNAFSYRLDRLALARAQLATAARPGEGDSTAVIRERIHDARSGGPGKAGGMRVPFVITSMFLAACGSQPAADSKAEPTVGPPPPILGFIRDQCTKVLDEMGRQVELLKADLHRCDLKLARRRSLALSFALIAPCNRQVHPDVVERWACNETWRDPGPGLAEPVNLVAMWPLVEASQRDALDRAGRGLRGDVIGKEACDVTSDVLDAHLREFKARCDCEKGDDGFICEVRR